MNMHICFKCKNGMIANFISHKTSSNNLLYGCKYGINNNYNKITICTIYKEREDE